VRHWISTRFEVYRLSCKYTGTDTQVLRERSCVFTYLFRCLWYFVLGLRGKGKDKAVPLQAWTGPDGCRKLWFPDFVTTAQNGGRLSALRTSHLYPQ